MPRAVLFDTCTAIWFVAKKPLSEDSLKAIYLARSSNSGVYISPFAAWEIGMLVAKGRIKLTSTPEEWFDEIIASPGVRLAPLTPKILLASTSMTGITTNDPADRIVAATARIYKLTVITRDRLLLDYAKQGYIQAIAC
jgi:PIN domain nuclease of toxin-antitoxin system